MQAQPRPALFLDRDGVINVDRGYVSRREDFEWLPGIFDVARIAQGLGFALVVVTNQSGIGRGYYTEQEFKTLTAFMCERFVAEGVPLDGVYYCPFHPDSEQAKYRHPDHPWRKPRPGMILAARDELRLDLARSALVGDRVSDVEAGASAGVGALALIGCREQLPHGCERVERFEQVAQVAGWIAGLAKRHGRDEGRSIVMTASPSGASTSPKD